MGADGLLLDLRRDELRAARGSAGEGPSHSPNPLGQGAPDDGKVLIPAPVQAFVLVMSESGVRQLNQVNAVHRKEVAAALGAASDPGRRLRTRSWPKAD